MIKVWFDGSCLPNPGGIIGYGVVITRHEQLLHEISQTANIAPEFRTNNTAEYCGAIAAMKKLLACEYQDEEIYVFGDSQLVINQLAGKWEIGEGKYVKYAHMAKELRMQFTNICFEWISREDNTRADILARKGSGFFK